jgi:hypothetical protein
MAHSLESYSSPGRGTQVSVWHVAVSTDDVKVMTLEQLDDAFRLDVIDTSTPVWKAGMSTWSPLGVVAGIEEETTTTVVPSRDEPAALWPPPAWPPEMSAPSAVSNRESAPARSRTPIRDPSRPHRPRVLAPHRRARGRLHRALAPRRRAPDRLPQWSK